MPLAIAHLVLALAAARVSATRDPMAGQRPTAAAAAVTPRWTAPRPDYEKPGDPMAGQRPTAAGAVTPRWTAPRPDYEKPDAGLALVPKAEHVVVFTPTPDTGTYSHGAQVRPGHVLIMC